MGRQELEWFAPFSAPKDGTLLVALTKHFSVYLVYWGDIDGVEGWCDVDSGFAFELESFCGWILAPRTPDFEAILARREKQEP